VNGAAPSAVRMPISRVRQASENEISEWPGQVKRPAGSAQERLLQQVLSIFVTARYTVRRALHKLSTVSKYVFVSLRAFRRHNGRHSFPRV
jgi:hypothetical protein